MTQHHQRLKFIDKNLLRCALAFQRAARARAMIDYEGTANFIEVFYENLKNLIKEEEGGERQ